MTAVAPGVSPLSVTGLKMTTITGDEIAAISTASSVTVISQRMIYMPLLRRNDRT
jgi:hypothetical protein